MDIPSQAEIGEVRMSTKLPSRRKRSRPVKFYQDFIMTDSYEDVGEMSGNASPVSSGRQEVFGNSQSYVYVNEEPAYLFGNEVNAVLPDSSMGMIHRPITSIRDSTMLKGSQPKRKKMEEDEASEPDQQTTKQESQSTFSNLLHSFASQVNTRVESTDRRSPYKERSPIPKAIWPVQSSSSSVLPTRPQGVPSVTSRPCRPAPDPPASNSKQDMSFSGMLQNFVSCVNDSPVKDTSVSQPSLISMLTTDRSKGLHSSPFSASTSTPVKEKQQSFAGLLHSFASVVDRGNQAVFQEQRNQQAIDHLKRASPSNMEQPERATKSLLDVLHDTISRRVLESVSPQENMGISSQSTQLDKVMQYNLDLSDRSKAKQDERKDATEGGSMMKCEPEDELHPNGHQWSHIKNVLPPLDDSEEDTNCHQRDTNCAQESQMDRLAAPWEAASLHSGQRAAEDQNECVQSTTSSNIDNERDNLYPQVKIKQESVDEATEKEREAPTQSVNSTLRERLLLRIESRQSRDHNSMSSSSVPSPGEAPSPQPQDDTISGASHPREVEGNKQQNQAGLVSHLLSTGDSSHWRNRKSGSFADLLHNITSSILDRDPSGDYGDDGQKAQDVLPVVKQEPLDDDVSQPESLQEYTSDLDGHASGDDGQIAQDGLPAVKQEPLDGDVSQPVSVQDYTSSREHLASMSLSTLLERRQQNYVKDNRKTPRCLARLLSDPSQTASSSELDRFDGKDARTEKMKVVSYEEAPSSTSSPSISSDDIDQNNVVSIPNRNRGKMMISLPSRTNHSTMLKQRWKRGCRHGLKIKQGWPKRREDLQLKRDVRNQHGNHKPGSARATNNSNFGSSSGAQPQIVDSDTMSFTDILQKLAQKCQAGNQNPFLSQQQSAQSIVAFSPPEEHLPQSKQQLNAFQSDVISNVPSSASLRNLLMKQGSPNRLHLDADSPSGSPSTSSVQSRDVSFSNLMQNMASTVTKKKGSTSSNTPIEDLTSLDTPAPWMKSISGNWLRFLIISPDENPKVTMSVSVNLWNAIHEVKICCHHLEVPANHWIFRRFGKRIHTKAALQGILQAISNGCSVCEGTTRSDLVHMYRNKLAPTSRWQAVAVLEDSFGSATIRSAQCELLVTGLRRSREKRCSKCSKFVDRKLKAVMYHMKKKLGLS